MANPLSQVRSSLSNQRGITPNPDLTVRQALDRAAMNIGGRFDKQPLVEVAIRETIGGTYIGLGAFDLGLAQYKLAVELRSRVQGSQHPDTLKSRLSMASIYRELRLWPQAEVVLKQILEDARPGLRADDAIIRNAESLLVSVYQEDTKIQEAIAFLKDDVIPYEIRMLGEDDALTMSTIRRLVELYKVPQPAGSGNVFIPPPMYSEAEAFLKRIIADERRKLGGGHFSTLTNTNMLAGVYIAQNKFRDAEDLLTNVVPDTLVSKLVETGRLGLQEHPTALESMGLLVEAYTKDGKPAQADALLKSVMKLMDSGVPIRDENSASSLVTMVSMAGNYLSMGRDADAAAVLPKALEGYRRALSNGEPGAGAVGDNLLALARLYLKLMKYAEAQKLFRETLKIQREVLGEEALAAAAGEQIALIETHSRFGTFEYEKSEQFLEEVLSSQQKVLGERHTATRTTMWALSQAYWDHGDFDRAQGRVEQAQASWDRAESTISQLLVIFLSEPTADPSRVPGGTNTSITMIRLAYLLAGEGKYEKSVEAFSKFIALPRPTDAASGLRPGAAGSVSAPGSVLIANMSIGWLRLQEKRYSEAESILRETLPRMKNKDSGIADDEARFNCEAVLGASLVGQKRYAEAEGFMLSGYQGMTTALKSGSNTVRMSLEEAGSWIVRLYQEWGKPEEAALWQKKLGTNKASAALKP
jgi:tetratricopeptide (TPR) repeat protein